MQPQTFNSWLYRFKEKWGSYINDISDTPTLSMPLSGTGVLQQYTLTINNTGSGTGIITSDNGGINCGIDCTELYDAGTIVTLTATPDSDSIFDGWSGGAGSGTGLYVITLDAATTVTAAFDLISDDTPDIAVADLDESIGLEKEAEALMSAGNFTSIKQLLEDSNANHSKAINNMNKIWKGRELEIIVPSVALGFAKIVDDFILLVVLGIDEQWRRDLAQIIISTPIALREYVRTVLSQ